MNDAISTKTWDATKCKHDSVQGELWGAAVYEGRAMLDVAVEFSTEAQAASWAKGRAEDFERRR